MGSELTYSMLMLEVGGVVNMCSEDAKAEMKGQMDLKNEGNLVTFLDTLSSSTAAISLNDTKSASLICPSVTNQTCKTFRLWT